jgi:hypothetical protein
VKKGIGRVHHCIIGRNISEKRAGELAIIGKNISEKRAGEVTNNRKE